MKILYLDSTTDCIESSMRILPDSSLLRNNDHFYIPNFSSDLSTRACIVFKSNKLGKCFAPRFSERYYSMFAYAINIVASSKNHHTSICEGFDKSFAIGSQQSIDNLPSTIEFAHNDVIKSYDLSTVKDKVNEAFSKLSEYFTIKIGDLIVLDLGELTSSVQVGDKLNCTVGDVTLQTLIK